jgi:hypothetical protein
MFYPSTLCDPRMDGRGHKRKRPNFDTVTWHDAPRVPIPTLTEPAEYLWQTNPSTEYHQSSVSPRVGDPDSSKVSRANSCLHVLFCNSRPWQIKSTYDDLLECLSALVSQEGNRRWRDPYNASQHRPPEIVARASYQPHVLQDIARLAFQGIDLVARAQGAPADTFDSRSPESPAIWDNIQQYRMASGHSTDRNHAPYEHRIPPGSYDCQERTSNARDPDRPVEPSYHHSESWTIPPPTHTVATNNQGIDPYRTFPESRHGPRAGLEPPPISAAHFPMGSNSALSPTNPAEQFTHGEGGANMSGLPSGSLVRCLNCDKRETPEWRKGPYGPRTLCNACVSATNFCLVRRG